MVAMLLWVAYNDTVLNKKQEFYGILSMAHIVRDVYFHTRVFNALVSSKYSCDGFIKTGIFYYIFIGTAQQQEYSLCGTYLYDVAQCAKIIYIGQFNIFTVNDAHSSIAYNKWNLN